MFSRKMKIQGLKKSTKNLWSELKQQSLKLRRGRVNLFQTISGRHGGLSIKIAHITRDHTRHDGTYITAKCEGLTEHGVGNDCQVYLSAGGPTTTHFLFILLHFSSVLCPCTV